MKKSNFVALVLGTIGTVFFALGMCMALIEDWGMFRQGVVCGVIGMVVLLAALVIWRRMEGKQPVHLDGKTLGTVLVAVVGALLLGVGMCLSMGVLGSGSVMMTAGIIVGVVGLIGVGVNYPVYRKLLESGKSKYAFEIVQLAKEISEEAE